MYTEHKETVIIAVVVDDKIIITCPEVFYNFTQKPCYCCACTMAC